MIILTSQQQSQLRQLGVVFCYLFGSHGRGNPGPASDYDIALYLGPVKPSNYFDRKLDLIGFFSSLLRSDHLDIVILNEAPNLLAMNVIQEGKILMDDDRSMRTSFETKVSMQYMDYLPYAQRYLQTLIKRYA